MSTTPTPQPAVTIVSHTVDTARAVATVILQDQYGTQRHLQVHLGGPTACSACGRSFPLTTAAQPDVAALIATEQAAMQTLATKIAAYLAANPTATTKENP